MDAAAPLSEHYWFVAGNEARSIDMPVDEFWRQLMSGSFDTPIVKDVATADGWLVGSYEMTQDMETSEMHPEGDELHYLVSGRLDLVLESEDGNHVIELTPGASAVVRKGVWHRFVVHERGFGVAITFGRGTEHRPVVG